MKKHQKHIALFSMLVIALNFVSIFQYNILNEPLSFTVFAEEGDDTTTDEETPEVDPEEAVRQMTVDIQAEVIDTAEATQTQRFNELVDENFIICVPTNIGDHDNEKCNSNIKTSDRNFQRLLSSIANNEIRTVLEEPLGNENIFKRARVCRTQFLKDRFSRLQPVDISDREQYYDDISASIEALHTELEENGTLGSTNPFLDERYLITTGLCEEFFVKSCRSQNSSQTSVTGTNPLPIQVSCDQVQVLFASSGTELVKNYVGLIYRWAAGIIGVIAVLVIVIQGIRMSQSGGDQGKVDNAKTAIVQSLTALAVLFLAGILLSSINPNFFTQRDLQETPTTGITESE